MANVLTPMFRVSYPNVFKAKRNEMSGQDEYSLVALFPKGTDLKELQKAAHDAIVKKWGADKAKWPPNLRSPFRKQEERAKEVDGKRILPSGHEEGAFFLNLKSKQRPGIVDQSRNDIISETDFYAGCYARASVSCYAYDNKGNRGVAFGLSNLQKMKEGEPLGGRTRAQDDFGAIEIEGGAANGSTDDLFG